MNWILLELATKKKIDIDQSRAANIHITEIKLIRESYVCFPERRNSMYVFLEFYVCFSGILCVLFG